MQNVVGRLPKSYWWNELLRKHITKGYYPSRETFESKLGCCQQHHANYLSFSSRPHSRFKALELGTGTWPIVPLGLYLCGASEIWTYDIVPLLRWDTLKRTIELFSEYHRTGALERMLTSVQPQRLLHLEELLGKVGNESPSTILERLNIYVRIGDAQGATLPDNSIDLFFSTVVVELIDADKLMGMFRAFNRMASKCAVMSHYIGLGDQYASYDKSITPFNFMKYSRRQWRLLDNPIIPQNRLRLPEYRDLIEHSRWRIVDERNTSGSSGDLDRIRLASDFGKYSTEELLVLYSWLVARPVPKDG